MGITIARSMPTTVDDPNHPMWAGGNLGYDFEPDPTINNTSMPTGWAWVNQGNYGVFQKYGSFGIRSTSTDGGLHAAVQDIYSTSSAWTLTAKISLYHIVQNWTLAGFCVYDGTKATTWGYGISQYHRTLWGTTAGHTGGYSDYNIAGVVGNPWASRYWRLVFNSTADIDFLVSVDCRNWWPLISTTSVASGTYSMSTLTKVGFFGHNNTSTNGIAVDWWRVRAGADTP